MKSISYRHRGGAEPLIGVPIHVFLREVAARHADREALVSIPQGLRFNYTRFFREAERLAKGLLAFGVKRGDRVGIWAVDNAEWVLLQIATAHVGAILVNINPAYRVFELEHALRAARVQTLFLMPSFRKSDYSAMVRALCPETEALSADDFQCQCLPELKTIVLYDPDDAEHTERPAPGFRTWNEVLERGEAVSDDTLAARMDEIEADDPINIQFTSGTTGAPKPVVLTHHNILNNAYSIGEVLGLSSRDRVCVPVPFYHCFGMVVSNLGCLTHGACIVIPAPHFDAGKVLEAVALERCTTLHGVPTMFVAELEHEDFARYDLSCLRKGIMAGAPCPPELMTKVIEVMGIKDILIGYGQTEASPVTHLTRRGDSFDRRVETVGSNLPHQEAKVIDPATGRIVPTGVQGEVCFRGYHVMRGYFEHPEATREAIDEAGWLHSGDLGVMDDDGYLRITGRLKDMIIRGGENIYPAEIEAFYLTHPKVAQAAVFGIPDPKYGEQVVAWIQPHHGERATPEELQDFARRNIAHFKVPYHVRVVDEFPMTVTGKIQKFRMRELMEAELAAGTAC